MKHSWMVAGLALGFVLPISSHGPGDVTAISVLPGAGSALVVIDVSGAINVTDFVLHDPPRIVIDVEGGRLRVPGPLYDGENRGGIVHVRYAQFRPDVVRVVLDLDAVRDYELEYVDNAIRIAISTDRDFMAWSSGVLPRLSEDVDDEVDVGEFDLLPPPPPQQFNQDRITVAWDSASISDVMALFAEFSGRSIILGQGVQANIWAEIRDQPWDVAMKEILDANGFIADQDSVTGIVRILSPEAIAARDSLEPRETVIMSINFKRASEIAGALQAMIGTRGSVVSDTSTNKIILSDIISRIEQDTILVRQLDVPTPQVTIEAKLIFVDRTDIEQLGVRYDLGSDDQFSNRLVQRPDPSTLIGVDTDGDGVADAFAAEDTYSPDINIVDLGGNSLSAIGNATAQLPSSALQLIFSTAIGNFALTTFLEALQEVQLADLQAEPLITTSDNTMARVLVGERTPIRVIDASAQTGGGEPVATIQFEETGIQLEVTPHVTNTGQVMMHILTENSSLREAPSDVGFTLQTQNTDNHVLVSDGETMVIGGLTVTQVTVAKSGIPFLVDLPILGRIFGFTSRREQRRDLLILVTPTIVYDPLSEQTQ